MLINLEHTFTSPKGFIVVDGVNGAGKGTLIARLQQYLVDSGVSFISTREPGGSELGAKLRPLILGEQCCGPLTELFLFSADRNEHIHAKIKPALAKHQFVVSDRYYYSTTAFQGAGRGVPTEQIKYINELAVGDCLPDLFILLDVAPEIGLARTRKRNSAEYDKMEDEELDFHQRLRQEFLNIANSCAEPCLHVNAEQSAEEVWQYILPYINKLVTAWKTNLPQTAK